MKSKLFLLMAVCGMMLMSCQDNTPECYYHKKIIDLPVEPEAWKFDSINMQFYCRFKMPEITSYVYNYGDWSVHCEVNHGKDNAFQAVLPVSRFYSDTTREDVTNYYTQYIDYRIGVGYVDIQLTNSDHLYGQENPESMNFRLQANDDITLDLSVLQDEWKFDEQDGQYYCRFDTPEITEDIYNYGHFSVCREFNKGKKDAYQVPLPTSLFLSEIVPAYTPYYYSQALDYVVGVGYLDLQLTNSDYYYGSDGKPIPPETLYFRMVLTY